MSEVIQTKRHELAPYIHAIWLTAQVAFDFEHTNLEVISLLGTVSFISMFQKLLVSGQDRSGGLFLVTLNNFLLY